MNKKSINIVSCRLERDSSLKSNFQITKGTDVIKLIVNNFANLSKEYLFTINLDIKNKPQNISIIGIGNVNEVTYKPYEIFKPAILSNSSRIIMLHNHPSGNIKPSADDYRSFERVQECGKLLGIEILDSIVFGNEEKEWLSLNTNIKYKFSEDKIDKEAMLYEEKINLEIEEQIREEEEVL